MRKILLILLLTCTLPAGLAFGQVLEEEEGYTREFTYGLNFNTNGGLLGGAMIKQVYHLQNKWYHFWALEGVEVKHPKETRWQNHYTGASFVVGKSNYLFVLRPQYGREYTFFRKAAESGVQVNGLVAAGPSIGFLAPYYIQYDYTRYDNNGNPLGPPDVRTEQYDPSVHTQPDYRIVGSSGVFTGLAEPTLKFGGNIKAGVSFEYGRYMESVTGIEVGLMYEAFTSDIVIIPQATNSSSFTSVYLTLYYGRRR
ncbi:hypothetical protein [Rufibacter roseus]|uniref:Outer membrane protein beta-barrel domain-containing protein n=1 Tax=Rufibacter roseus TaxID=1567108 RepID=A0ABW2DJ53_9BACT|nr:hypothetical protein [Rufibacter roseus]